MIASDIQQADLADSISLRHRNTWGFDCPAVNLDFIMCEYNYGQPVALADYKRCSPYAADPAHHNNAKALIWIANKTNLPLFYIYYSSDWVFALVGKNKIAQDIMASAGIVECRPLSELELVTLLYALRSTARDVPDHIVKRLNTSREWNI